MPVLVISDIHANLTALDAVLADAGPIDAAWCLGDVVGYGPDPNECVARIQELPGLVCLVGNHDAAALGLLDIDAFNAEARTSVRWVQSALSDDSRDFLSRLPEMQALERVTLSHGSPRNPVWEYILDTRVARSNFGHFSTPYCFVGHTHLPILYVDSEGQPATKLTLPLGQSVQLTPRAIFNPGSVGQPRDRDPRASYALYEPETDRLELRRVAYDIPTVQQRILEAGLPQRHALRLAEGW